jgi:hypothetical protein
MIFARLSITVISILLIFLLLCISCCTSVTVANNTYSNTSVECVMKDSEIPPSSSSIELNTITLSFIGDCMLASYKGEYNWNTFNYRADNEDPSYFFAGVSHILINDDFTIANCENVFTDNNLSETDKGYEGAYWYKSRSANASIFKKGGVDIISLANNHIYDYGEQGKYDTIIAAEDASLLWGDDGNPVIVEKYGYKIAFICVFFNNNNSVSNTAGLLSELSMSTDFQVIFFHGGTERVYKPPGSIIEIAHRF